MSTPFEADVVRMLDNMPELTPYIRRVRGGYLKIQGTWMKYEVRIFSNPLPSFTMFMRSLPCRSLKTSLDGPPSLLSICDVYSLRWFIRVAYSIREDLIPLFG